MLNLILVVLSIALTALFLLISINYLNPSNQSAVNYGKMAIIGFESIQNGLRQYTAPLPSAFGSTPTTTLVDKPIPGPGSLVTTLTHGVPPSAPPTYNWSYGISSGQPYACLSGSATTPAIYKGLLQAYNRFTGPVSPISLLPASYGCATSNSGLTAQLSSGGYVLILHLQTW